MTTMRITGDVVAARVGSRGARAAIAALASVAIVFGGLLAIAILFGPSGWSWLLVIWVGFVAGAVDGRARHVWLALAGVALWHATAMAFALPRDTGPFWYIAAVGYGILLAVSYVIGADVGWRTPPLEAARHSWASLGRWGKRLPILALVAAVVLPIGYSGVILAIGPNMFTHPDAATDCRTPATAYGWTYEAINYDIAADQALAPYRTISKDGAVSWLCGGTPATAENAVVTTDGIRLAGWYVPAASGARPAGPTVVLVHG